MAVTRGLSFSIRKMGALVLLGSTCGPGQLGMGGPRSSEGLPGVGRAPGRSGAELTDSKPGLSSGPLLGFLLPFRVIPGPAGSLAGAGRQRSCANVVLPEPRWVGWRAQSRRPGHCDSCAGPGLGARVGVARAPLPPPRVGGTGPKLRPGRGCRNRAVPALSFKSRDYLSSERGG